MARTEAGAQLEEQDRRGRQADQDGEPEPEISIRGLTKTFGPQTVFDDVTCDIPKGKVTLILGPSGTGKSVFLKHIMGLLRPDKGEIWIDGKNIPELRSRDLYLVRRKFGVLFQDGALFGSMTIYDNVAFPLREHTKKSEREIRDIVSEKLKLVGLEGAETKLPGQISGGMRKRAGLARGLVLEPEILMFDEPDSGLDPVRTAFLNELILDLNRKLGTTIIVVTHDIATARRIADYIGMLYLRKLVQFGPAKDMFESDIPAVKQFLAGQTEGPIGMSEEADRSKPVSTSGMTAEETEELERQAGAPPEGEADQAAFAGGGEGEETTKAREEALESAKKRQEEARKEDDRYEEEDRETPQTDDQEEGFLTGILKRSKESDQSDERFENFAQAGQSQPAESPTEEEVKVVGRRTQRQRRRRKGKAADQSAAAASEPPQAESAEKGDGTFEPETYEPKPEEEWKEDVL
ncbi:MAG TPA: ATP-binding cassette domain-containing protein [Actinomycetota bacterium]|nr:ATP-binding cassette domain-containing protein [Actinomycetota bacterium]